MTLDVALVGCGKIADGHLDEIRKLPHLGHVVAVCDREPLMAEQLALRFAVPNHYDDFERMIEVERPDVVHITTPPGPHLALTKAAVDAGCHVYVEKPLTLHHEDAVELVSYVKDHDKKLTIGTTYPFDPPALELRRMVEEGLIGEPVHVETMFGYNLSGPFGAALLGDGSHWVHGLPGKLFHNNFDHALSRIMEFIPDESPRIVAFGMLRREERFGDVRDDLLDELRVTILGERTTAYASFSAHARPPGQFMRVYGTRNTAHVDYMMRTVTLESSGSLPSAIGRLVPAFEQSLQLARAGTRNLGRFAHSDFHYMAGMNTLIDRFYRCIVDGGEPPISYRDILRISAWSEEIYKQLGQTREERT